MHMDFSDAGALQIRLHSILFNNFGSYPVFRQILATIFSLDYYVLGDMLLWIHKDLILALNCNHYLKRWGKT